MDFSSTLFAPRAFPRIRFKGLSVSVYLNYFPVQCWETFVAKLHLSSVNQSVTKSVLKIEEWITKRKLHIDKISLRKIRNVFQFDNKDIEMQKEVSAFLEDSFLSLCQKQNLC